MILFISLNIFTKLIGLKGLLHINVTLFISLFTLLFPSFEMLASSLLINTLSGNLGSLPPN